MNMGRRPGKCEQAVRIARPSPVISIRRREEIGSRLRQRRRRASRHRVIASRRAQRRGVVQPAGLCDSDGYAQTATCLARAAAFKTPRKIDPDTMFSAGRGDCGWVHLSSARSQGLQAALGARRNQH